MIADLLKEKKEITIQYRRRVENAAKRYSRKMEAISKSFDEQAQRMSQSHLKRLKNLKKDYEKKFRSFQVTKKHCINPAIRKKVIKEICEYYGYEVEQVLNPRRGKREISECRQVIYYFLICNRLGTYEEIGGELNRDYSSMYNGILAVKDLLDTNDYFKANFNNIKERVEEIINECLNIENGA